MKNNFYFRAFIINFFIAFFCLLPFLLLDNGYFSLPFDFIGLSLPCEILQNILLKSNCSLWTWGIDLGSNWLASLSFGNLLSPFTVSQAFLPNKFIPYLLPLMICIKFSIAGLVSAIYIKRYCREDTAILFSLLYSFSGYQIINIIFYWFLDIVALFPLLLIGIELLLEDKKKYYFSLAVCLNIFCNPVFFLGEVIFVILYFIIKYAIYNIKGKKYSRFFHQFFSCFCEAVIGVLMASIVLLPSLLNVVNLPRANEKLCGSNFFTITTLDFIRLLQSVFFPPEPMSKISSVVKSDWMSNSLYIPCISIILCFSYLQKQKNWLTKLLICCFLISIFPVLNNLFFGLTSTPYRRWFYMFELLIVLASGFVMENFSCYFTEIKKSIFIYFFLFVLFLFMVTCVKWDFRNTSLIFSYRKFFFEVFMAILSIICVAFFLVKRSFLIQSIFFSIFIVVSFGANVYSLRKTTDNTGELLYLNGKYSKIAINNLIEIPKNLTTNILPYRYFFDNEIGYTYYNYSMINNLPSINSFLSNIHSSIFDFYESLGFPKGTMTPVGPIGTNELLGARFVVSRFTKNNLSYIATLENSDSRRMYLYENKNALPIGFTYDSYISKTEFFKINRDLRAVAMLSALVVDDKDIDDVSKTLPHFQNEITTEYLTTALESRRKECSHKFEWGNNFFQSSIHSDSDKYAFFAVPYDRYWHAFINGKEQSILNINGLMAVEIKEGNNEIKFMYKYTPFVISCILSLAGFLLLFAYILINSSLNFSVFFKSFAGKVYLVFVGTICFYSCYLLFSHFSHKSDINTWWRENDISAKNIVSEKFWRNGNAYICTYLENTSYSDILLYISEHLLNKSHYSIFIAVCDEAAVSITDEVIEQLHSLGLQQSLKGKIQHGYVAVIDRGNVVYEKLADASNIQVITEGKLDNGLKYHIESAGLPAGNFCSIIINGHQQAVNRRGLNFVVYDNELGKVVDSVAFDTWAEGMPCYR